MILDEACCMHARLAFIPFVLFLSSAFLCSLAVVVAAAAAELAAAHNRACQASLRWLQEAIS